MLEAAIKKKLGDFTLDVSFAASDGMLGLLGVSGCGKSMTLKCIAGIETPDEGRIVLNGRVLFDSKKRINLPPQKRHVGYLFQQYALFPNMTVRQNIAAGVRNRAKTEEVTEEIIKRLRLTGLEDKRPGQLSGGQQQRTALARILVNEPEALLLDEPFSALDNYLKWELEMELADALDRFDGISLFVSHNRREVYRLCSEVCVLSEGKSVIQCSVKSLFENPETVSSCKLAGCRNFSVVTRTGEKTVKALDWNTDINVSLSVKDDITHIAVREDRLTVAQEEGENTIRCRVMRAVEDEKEYIIMLKAVGGSSELCMETDKKTGAGIAVGKEILVRARPEDIMLLRE